jgi:hypothetical protein
MIGGRIESGQGTLHSSSAACAVVQPRYRHNFRYVKTARGRGGCCGVWTKKGELTKQHGKQASCDYIKPKMLPPLAPKHVQIVLAR